MTTQHPLRTADQILAAAAHDPHISARQMGEISAHVAAGDLGSARTILTRTNRQVVAKAPEIPFGTADAPVPTHLQLARQVQRLEQRVAELEDRPVGQPSTLAKAASVKASKRLDPAVLHSKIDKDIDSVSLAGQLSSLIQQGQLEKVADYLESAELTHEAEKARRERASWK